MCLWGEREKERDEVGEGRGPAALRGQESHVWRNVLTNDNIIVTVSAIHKTVSIVPIPMKSNAVEVTRACTQGSGPCEGEGGQEGEWSGSGLL